MTDGKDEFSNFIQVISIIVPIIFIIIILIGSIGNALVVTVILKSPKMKSTTNLLILNLAISDLLFISICVSTTAQYYAFGDWKVGKFMCKMVRYVTFVEAYACVYTLVLMSLDRFLAVVFPVTSLHIRTKRNTYCIILLVWFIILLANVPNFFVWTIQSIPSGRVVCLMKEDQRPDILHICFFIFAYAIPLCIILILYVYLLRCLWKRPSKNKHHKRKVTRMVITVVCVFAICWLPIHLCFIVIFSQNFVNKTIIALQIAAQCLAYTNSCLNPILYTFLCKNFRKAYLNVLCFRRSKRKAAVTQATNQNHPIKVEMQTFGEDKLNDTNSDGSQESIEKEST